VKFLQALLDYKQRNSLAVEQKLDLLLRDSRILNQPIFVKKIARTLARAYFEQKKYLQAYDIYENFLLKVDPQFASDWLEAAWSLYYTKRSSEALGILYNLNTKSNLKLTNLEVYTLRALIYRSLCLPDNASQLVANFSKDFQKTLDGIRKGKPLKNYPILLNIDTLESRKYHQMVTQKQRLIREKEILMKLNPAWKNTAVPLIDTQVTFLKEEITRLTPMAFEAAANHLILIQENLKFLLFDVQREQFNSEQIFAVPAEEIKTVIPKDSVEKTSWRQMGDYWLDERLKYEGIVENQCKQSF
jgi:hypothetical protein